MKEIELKIPSRHQPVWKKVGSVLKIFFKKPEIINLNDDLPQKAIYVANHSAMNGPVVYSLYFPRFSIIWGAHPMLGDYNSRFHYLRDVYFIQKRGMKKFPATLIAGFEALFSIYFYRGMKVAPTYTDGRLKRTIKHSNECLDQDMSVIIFPEDSSEGYHEKLTSFFPGFVMLAKYYQKTHNEENIPIYPVYYHKKLNKLVIGKPSTLADYPNMDRQQIADSFCAQVNDLLKEYVLGQDK